MQQGSRPEGVGPWLQVAADCNDKAMRPLQAMLLQAVCNSSVQDAKRDIPALVCSTLLAQQADFAVVHHATMMALSYLKCVHGADGTGRSVCSTVR